MTHSVTRDAFDRKWFEKVNPGFKTTGELLREEWNDGGSQTLVVFKGSHTPYGMCRDCGDHYIIARWSRYDRVDKDTMAITKDVEDR